jgi:hypothetical protein
MGSEYMGYRTSLLDLPIASLAQICSYLHVKDLLKVDATCKLLGVVVEECLSDYKVLEVSDQPAKAVQPVLKWAAKSGKINSLSCFRASGKACKVLVDTCLKTISRSIILWPQLKHLHVTYCRGLKDDHIFLMTRLWPRLATLNLAGCVNLSDEALHHVADNLCQLQVFDCSNWMYITDDAVSYLAYKQPALKRVCLDGCARVTSLSIASLAQQCAELQTISASNCYRVCDSALHALADHGAITNVTFKQCPKLSYIHSLSTCSSLTTLDISGCPFVTDSNLHQLLRPTGNNLLHLVLNGCVGLTGAALQSIASFCPNILSLNVSRMEVVDNDLLHIARGCRHISQLVIEWCSKLSDRSLIPFAQANPALVSVSMEGVYNATDAFLHALAAHCAGLEALNIRTCVQLTVTGIVKLACLANLRVVHLAGIMNDASTMYLVSQLQLCRPSCQLCF